MYSSTELFLLALVLVSGFKLLTIMILAMLRLSHVSLRARRSARRNAEIIQLAVAIRLHNDTRLKRRHEIIKC